MSNKYVTILAIFLMVQTCFCSPDVKRLQKTLTAANSQSKEPSFMALVQKNKVGYCTDSTSVYCCDVAEGAAEILGLIPEVGEILEAIDDIVSDIVCAFDCGDCNNYCCSGGCVAPETLITMADNSLKRIDQIQVGEWVMTATEGEKAQVMFIDEAPAQTRYLNGFGENSQPFVSEDHVMISNTNGLVSIDVKKALSFEPQFANQLTTLKNGVDLRVYKNGEFRSENVSNIVKQSIVDPNTILYNLILKTGHTYIANGYALSDHFPDLSRFPKMFKMLHWILRENLGQVENFFADHNKYDMKPLINQITRLITSYIAEHKQ